MHQIRGEKNINYNKVKQHASGTFFFLQKVTVFFFAQPILIFKLSLVEKKNQDWQRLYVFYEILFQLITN